MNMQAQVEFKKFRGKYGKNISHIFDQLQNNDYEWCKGFTFELHRLIEGLYICARHPSLPEPLYIREVANLDDLRMRLGEGVRSGKETLTLRIRELARMEEGLKTVIARANIRRTFSDPDLDTDDLWLEQMPGRFWNPFWFGNDRCYIFCKGGFVYFSLDVRDGAAMRIPVADFARISEHGQFLLRSYDFSVFFWEQVAKQFVLPMLTEGEALVSNYGWHNACSDLVEVRDRTIIKTRQVHFTLVSTDKNVPSRKLTVNFARRLPVRTVIT